MKYHHFYFLHLNQHRVENYHLIKDKISMISASEFGALFGVSDHMSVAALWRKLVEGKIVIKPPTPATVHGKVEEKYSKEKFFEVWSEQFPQTHYINHQELGTGFLQRDPRFCASPDGIFSWSYTDSDDIQYGNFKEGLELKNPFSRGIPKQLDWTYCGYLLQCVLSMEVFEVDRWNLFFYERKTGDYAWFIIHRNRQFFEDHLRPALDRLLQLKIAPKMKRSSRKVTAEAIMNQFIIDTVKTQITPKE